MPDEAVRSSRKRRRVIVGAGLVVVAVLVGWWVVREPRGRGYEGPVRYVYVLGERYRPARDASFERTNEVWRLETRGSLWKLLARRTPAVWSSEPWQQLPYSSATDELLFCGENSSQRIVAVPAEGGEPRVIYEFPWSHRFGGMDVHTGRPVVLVVLQEFRSFDEVEGPSELMGSRCVEVNLETLATRDVAFFEGLELSGPRLRPGSGEFLVSGGRWAEAGSDYEFCLWTVGEDGEVVPLSLPSAGAALNACWLAGGEPTILYTTFNEEPEPGNTQAWRWRVPDGEPAMEGGPAPPGTLLRPGPAGHAALHLNGTDLLLWPIGDWGSRRLVTVSQQENSQLSWTAHAWVDSTLVVGCHTFAGESIRASWPGGPIACIDAESGAIHTWPAPRGLEMMNYVAATGGE